MEQTCRCGLSYMSDNCDLFFYHILLQDACLGDSGSPLMIKHETNSNEWLLVGVMSAGLLSDKEDCEKLGGFSAYADLSFKPIRTWIERVVGEATFFQPK